MVVQRPAALQAQAVKGRATRCGLERRSLVGLELECVDAGVVDVVGIQARALVHHGRGLGAVRRVRNSHRDIQATAKLVHSAGLPFVDVALILAFIAFSDCFR